MSYIAPNSAVRLLAGVPLQPDYNNTILFTSLAAQSSYFYSKRAWEGNNYSFVRCDGDSGEIMIQAQFSNVFACNYMMYSNTSFVDKWFYAFVVSVEYVNNNTVRVKFIVDHMQTWLFGANLTACYIERAHTPTDEIGQDATAEDLTVNDYVTITSLTSGQMGKLGVMVLSTFTPDQYTGYTGGMYAGTFSGLCGTFFSLLGSGNTYPDPSSLKLWLAGVENAGKSEGIVSMVMVPSGFVFGSGQIAESTTPTHKTISLSRNQTALDGYAPKNKRLLSYPYNKLSITNMTGSTMDYRFEDLGYDPMYSHPDNDPTKCYFSIYGDVSCDPEIVLAPKYYHGLTTYNGNNSTYYQEDMTKSLSIRGFPQCAWNADIYKIWLGNKKTQVGNDLLSSAVNLIGAAAISTVAPGAGTVSAGVAAVNAVSTITSAVAENAAMKREPPQVKSSQNSTIMSEIGFLDFLLSVKTVRREQARIFDDYFTMYGYAIKKCQVPNRNARPHWTYVKTIGARIDGNIPAEANKKLVAIYDAGVRFWNNPSEIGNYTLDNSPVS